MTSTPWRIRLSAAALAVLTAGLATTLAVASSDLHDDMTTIGHRAAPQASTTADLYFEVSEMDADVANDLLVGGAQNLGTTTARIATDYEKHRRAADADLQTTVEVANQSQDVQSALRAVIDGLGQYEALAADALQLEAAGSGTPARPPAAALTLYRTATDLMHSQILPAANTLTGAGSGTVDATYQSARGEITAARIWVLILLAALLAVLIWLQVLLVQRFHRLLNPLLALSTLLVIATGVAGLVLLSAESTQLRIAKPEAFDSIIALSQARAVGYDANADESRWLVDPGRADQYQTAFLAKSQQLADLPNATITTYDSELAAALTSGDMTGYLGTEIHNITFPGEYDAAMNTLRAYQTYEKDDRTLRSLDASGQLDAAIAFDTGSAQNQSDYAFTQYDNALTNVIGINQQAFDAAVTAGLDDVSGWTAIPAALAAATLALITLGLRPRLREYA
jgi:hypothetical protein